ncbi:MAG: hypothetical protein OXI46_00475 [Gemmatimonadota bacterium]|nr:hypothetical protein [Gemmatimonadota bacterium]
MEISAARSWFGSRWIPTARSSGLAAAGGFAAAGLGCYVPDIPLAFALAGLVPAAIARSPARRFAIALGWHAAPMLPAAVGLWHLGGTGITAGLLAAWWVLTALAFAWLNTGIAIALSLMIPWHIGSVVLAAGDLWPGAGNGGLALMILVFAALSAQPGGSGRWRRLWLLIVLAMAAASVGSAWQLHVPARPSGFTEVRAWPRPALTTAAHDRSRMAALERITGDILVLGENVVHRSEPSAIDRWCEFAARQGSLLYVGVLEPDGTRSTIHALDLEHCVPRPVYERTIGLPGVTGGWRIGQGDIEAVLLDDRRFHWTICFETFTPLAWLLKPGKRGAIVAVIANDRWVRPVPVAVMREKVGRSMARLWGMAPVFATTDRTVSMRKSPVNVSRDRQ